MILLTGEGVLRAKLKDMNSKYPHLTTEAIRRKLTLHSEDNEVAKAQLKQVVEEQLRLNKAKVFGFEEGTLLLYKEDWQALLDEVK